MTKKEGYVKKSSKRLKVEDYVMMWGFIFFSLGAIGLIQIGLLEGLQAILIASLFIFILGIAILICTVIWDRMRIGHSK